MEDSKIIDLLFKRSDDAIRILAEKYEKTCQNIAFNILRNRLDTEECINDTYLKVWNSIPPKVPDYLKGYILKIVRNTALNMLDCKKRQQEHEQLIFTELKGIISKNMLGEQDTDNKVSNSIDAFLRTLDPLTRDLFIKRYFGFEKVSDLATAFNMNPSTVSTILNRTRNRLKKHLEKDGIIL